MHHAARIIERLVEQRDTRHASLIEGFQQLTHRFVFIDRDDIGARHHHVIDAQHAEAQNTQQHLALFGGEGLGRATALECLFQCRAQGRATRQTKPHPQGL